MSPSKRDRRRKPDPTTPTEPSDGGQGSTNNPYRTPSQPTTGCDCDQIICLLDKIARTTCLTANEVHRNGTALKSIAASLQALVEMYRTVESRGGAGLRPPGEAARAVERMLSARRSTTTTSASTSRARREAERGAVTAGRPSRVATSRWCRRRRDTRTGRSSKGLAMTKTQGVAACRWERSPDSSIRASQRRSRWTFAAVRGRRRPARQGPVGFRTFTETELAQNWPPDMSGARGGDVVLMSGNLWLKLSVDGGKTFTDLDFTKLFAQRHRLRRLGRRPGHPLHPGDRLLRSVCSVVQRHGHTGQPQHREDRDREPGRSQEVLGRQSRHGGGNGTSRRIRSGSARHGWIFPT